MDELHGATATYPAYEYNETNGFERWSLQAFHFNRKSPQNLSRLRC